MNQRPVFDSKIRGPFFLKPGEDWNYKLPTYSDPDGHNVTLSVDLGEAGIFVSRNNRDLFFSSTTTSKNVGIYNIYLKLTDEKGASNKYSFSLIINETV